jgi:hypothetical protein
MSGQPKDNSQRHSWLMNKAVFGYLVVGVASLIGGIFIFAFIVIPQLQPDTGVPRDVQLIFTEVFSRQSLMFKERGVYTPAMIEVGLDQETCRKYTCMMTVDATGKDYVMKLSKDGMTWQIHSKSPVPKEAL